MLVLHTHWDPPLSAAGEGRLIFWLEENKPARTRINRNRRHTRPHPFTSAALDVKQQLSRLCGTQLIALRVAKFVLWLPTGKLGPQPSPQVQLDWGMPGDRLQLLPWRIEGLQVTLAQAFSLFMQLPDPAWLPRDIRLGDDTRYWRTAVTLLLESLARQKIFPGMRRTPPPVQLVARWLPLFTEAADSTRLARLETAMPPLCRAGAETPDAARPPRALLDAFLHSMLDAVVRSWWRQLDAKHPPHAEGNGGSTWLAALTNLHSTLSLTSAAREPLWNAYQLWQRNLTIAGDDIYRVALRLEPPEEPAAAPDVRDWVLSFWLQARDDPSLLLPAEEVWGHGGSISYLGRQFHQPEERLLTALGYITRFFPPIKRALQQEPPTHLDCTAAEAYQFLRECAPLLEQSGFGLFVPSWWHQPQARLGVQLQLDSSAAGAPVLQTGFLSLDKLVAFQWRLSLGDQQLTREEFERLVALKTPLVQIRGRWVRLDPEQVEAAIRFWQKRPSPPEPASLAGTLQLVLQPPPEAGGLPVEKVAARGWLQEWLAQLQDGQMLRQLPPPEGLEGRLRPYQRFGYSWLHFMRRWGMGAILADDMGLGKTVMALAMLLQVKEEQGALPGPVLLVCPTSVVTNWQKEAHRFTPGLRTLVHQGPDRRRDETFHEAVAQHDLLLTSYALVRRDAAQLQEVAWHGIILDEAQNIKNPGTQQARILRRLPADFRCALTGTPIENRLAELWSIMQFLNPGFLGSRKTFHQTFALPIEKYRDEAAAERLRRLTSPFILRRIKADPTVIQDLPEKQELKVYCHLTPEQATLYAAVVEETLAAVAAATGIERRGLVLAMLTKLKQICNHPAQFLRETEDEGDAARRSGKIARLGELLEEVIAEGDRALIFTQFTKMGDLLHHYLQQTLGVPALYLHGGVPANRREMMITRFQEEPGGPPLFLLSLKAGGTGLNLTRANHVFHFDRWWNPAVEDQATDRAFRIGQHRNVLVHKFVCIGTLEEKIDEMLTEKKALAEQIVGSGENWLTEMSTAELAELVTLRQEAFA